MKYGRPKILDSKKIYCEVIEGVVYSDRCLWKLSKIIEGRTCETCILRKFEEMESAKTKRSSDINITSDIKILKVIKGLKRSRRKIEAGLEKKPKPIKNESLIQTYSSQELIELLGKPERIIRKWAQKGKIPAHKIGKKWLFPKEEIDHWLSERGTLNLQCNHTVMTTNGAPQQEGVRTPDQKTDSISVESSEEENINERSL